MFESLWIYWGEVVGNIFIRVLAILLIISGIDYFYNWITLQRKMRMTKQMVKEELKNRLVPIELLRTMPNGTVETWKINEFK